MPKLKIDEANFEVSGVRLQARPRADDPLGMRETLGLTFVGGLSATFDAKPRGVTMEEARATYDAALQFCEDVYARCFKALASSITNTAGASTYVPPSAAEYIRKELANVEQERDEALSKLAETKARLDELRKLFAPAPSLDIGGMDTVPRA